MAIAAGPADGRSGTGDYAQDLIDEVSGARVETMDCNDSVALAKRTVRAGSVDADVIHVSTSAGSSCPCR